MWTTQISVGIIFAGILFMLWFLLHLLREQPLRMRKKALAMPLKRVAVQRLRFEKTWAAAKREHGTAIFH
jgi:hypothetical protein